MSKEPSAAQRMIADIAPKLADFPDSVLFGDVWEEPELSKRDRSPATSGGIFHVLATFLRTHFGVSFVALADSPRFNP